MKKNFSSPYLPAQIRKTKQGWYIIFYQTDPKTGERRRFRITFDINRIRDKKLRLVRAKQLVHEINLLLPHGYPFSAQISQEMHTPLTEALEMAHTVKCQTDRKRTVQMYESVQRIFLAFLKKKKLEQYTVSEFGRREAMQFMDWLILERRVGARTYNNYLIRVKSLFNALVEREYIFDNPFNKIQKKPEPEKQRRTFTAEEKKVVAAYIRAQDPWLYLAVLLQYYCYIRPVELRRLRFSHFDLSMGIISLPPTITKNKKRRNVTIPLSIMPYFLQEDFTKWPLNFLIFGKAMLPHPDKACNHNTMNHRHRQVLKKLKKMGKLHTIENLTFYSWKDTGITDSDATLYEDMTQAGHQDPKITLIYKRSKQINEGMRHTKKEL